MHFLRRTYNADSYSLPFLFSIRSRESFHSFFFFFQFFNVPLKKIVPRKIKIEAFKKIIHRETEELEDRLQLKIKWRLSFIFVSAMHFKRIGLYSTKNFLGKRYTDIN